MDTTNIDDLPSDQVAMGGNVAQQHNITMQMSEAGAGMQGGSPMVGSHHQPGYTPNTVSEPNTTYNPNINVNAPSQRTGEGANSAIHEQKLMNELVTGLQQASAGVPQAYLHETFRLLQLSTKTNKHVRTTFLQLNKRTMLMITLMIATRE